MRKNINPNPYHCLSKVDDNIDRQTSIEDYFDKAVLTKYNVAGPRYTSYPTAVSFHPNIRDEDIDSAISNLAHSSSVNKNLAIYVHIPFCHELCYYCGCNKIVTRHQEKAELYLQYLKKEMHLVAHKYKALTISELHLGGGTPNFLTIAQLTTLVDSLKTAFNFRHDAQLSIEIDPRTVDKTYIIQASNIGFNRLSIGVQDTDKRVQKQINRVQSTIHIADLIDCARQNKFRSINLDLIYGLPMQTRETFFNTLEAAKTMDPDRISLFSYAHLPNIFAAQRKIKEEYLPSSTEKFALFRQAIDVLTKAGYDFIGMDHFAKKSDELSLASKNKVLGRNFQGYTSSSNTACLGLGVSSISNIDNVYTQNEKKLSDYYKRLDLKQSPVIKGLVLAQDDEIRRDLIHQLMCNFEINKTDFSQKHQINFDVYFAHSRNKLTEFIEDGLLSDTKEYLTIHPRGRLIVRNICMSFDEYLSQPMHQMRYSRVI
ncbi:oxygen-independent coproporphyrinogen III oxidase [Agaribacter flavus]|uniref:Coproporphyrinogen-III oxidase n=1 Tax=Agaribacter flavus TaxID=1902781 RepID=A0ABV7FM24_9ALTE